MSATSAVPMGFQGVLYFLSTGARATWASSQSAGVYNAAPPSGLTRIGNVRNVKESAERDKADVTTRDQGGWKATALGLAGLPADFDVVVNRTDAGQLALLQSFQAGLTAIPEPTSGTLTFQQAAGTNTYSGNTTIALAFMDGPLASGDMGWWADLVITKCERVEDLKDAIVFNINAEPGPSLIPPQLVQCA